MSERRHFVLIADTYPPMRSSGAVQLRDLSREFYRQGHSITLILPDASINAHWQIEKKDGVRILRLRSPKTKDVNYVQRTISEFLMPFFMRYRLNRCPLITNKWDGVMWYSPSIFHGPFAYWLKKTSDCKGYLIIRDIFPEWALDMGLMNKGIPYFFFKMIARYQYSVADIIGVQTPGNLAYFKKWQQSPGRNVEVLQNWLDKPATLKCSIRLDNTNLAGRKIFVYAGNMGVAQGMDILLDLVEIMKVESDVGFLFVGRGSETERLKNTARARSLNNLLFFDEIDPDSIPDLYSQCHIGLVALDSRHKSHNIPGKFLTYMQNSLPVLANINEGNDLATVIRNEAVGQVCESNEITQLVDLANKLLEQITTDIFLQSRCRNLFEKKFSVKQTVKQVVSALEV